MPAPASDPNDTSKLKKSNPRNMDNLIHSRLPSRKDSSGSGYVRFPQSKFPALETVAVRFKFLPVFWTIASLISLSVNIILLITLVILSQTFRTIQLEATDQASSLIGGLYTNFAKLDQVHVKTTIPIQSEVPVQFTFNVSGPTQTTLSEPVHIDDALVTIQTGNINITNARASITLPQGTVLPLNIENLAVPISTRVLVALEVPIDIPLDQTEFHEPLVGFQEVIKPWYCLVNPNASLYEQQICP